MPIFRRAGSQPVMDSGRTDRMPHLDRKRPGGRTSPGARGEVTKSLGLNKRKAMRTGMRMPKTLLDCFSGALLGALTAATAGLSCVAGGKQRK